MRLGVFGGSFDPIHHGHLLAATVLAEALGLEEVRLIVARQQPLKAGGGGAGSHHASPEDRAAMVEAAVAGSPWLRTERMELQRPGPSFMVDTLRALKAGRPEAELVLVLGSDAAAELPQWREADAIRTLARIEVFARGRAREAGGAGVAVPRVDISSTAIRARVRAGLSIRYWVPDAVADYIATHRLYRAGEA